MLRRIGRYFWRFMVIFSFIVNAVLVVVLVSVLLLIFDIKHNIAEPLLQGLHSSFVGLNDSTIDWTIPVRDTITVKDTILVDDRIYLNTSIPLNTNTTVVLTDAVNLSVTATITLPGVGVLNNAQVNLALPQGLVLPVALNLQVPINNLEVPVKLTVPVELKVPVALDVRAVIPLSQTQLHDPVDNLRLTLEPIVRILGNLPGSWAEVGPFISSVLSGQPPDLLAQTPYTLNPWPGYSRTAGVGYTLAAEPFPPGSIPFRTGLVPLGGIPALDQPMRPELYENGSTPQRHNALAEQNLAAKGVAPAAYSGDEVLIEVQAVEPGSMPAATATPITDPNTAPTSSPPGAVATSVPDLGIMPTPTPIGG